MPIDIRATVTCTLGTLISGSISDDYLQGSGLVKTKGTCEISGLITPAMGTAVTFSYTKDSVTRTIPRKLRVLSSFADPFRRTTKVELGCKLTYLSDLQEPVKWSAFDDDENNDYDEDDLKIVTLPIHASSAMDKCLTELGITASSNPLTNKFSVAEFDFGGGYVQVLSDLLVSESYFGYLDMDEVLQVVALGQEGGTGPVYGSTEIVDVAPIGVGQLPGEAVTVSYSSLKLKDPSESGDSELLDWETTLIVGLLQTVEVENIYYPRAPLNNSIFPPEIYEYVHRPSTLVQTFYDEFDRVSKRVTEESTIIADAVPAYLQYLSGFFGLGLPTMDIGNSTIKTITIETFKYKNETNANDSGTSDRDELVEQVREVEEPYLKYFASTNIYSAIGSPADAFNTGKDYMVNYRRDLSFVTERVVTTFRYGVGRSGAKVVETITDKFLCKGYTQRGQQALANALTGDGDSERYTGSFEGSSEINDQEWVKQRLDEYSQLEYLGAEVQTVTGREIALQERPSSADVNNANYADGGDVNNGWRTESKAQLELALGSATAQRRIEFTMPYAPDDIFSGPSGGPFTSVASDAPVKANLYGRVQNRLLLGNRSGINIQVAPERLPAAPFSPLYVQANGLTALYRANGNQWAFDSSGIVCSTDALFWAAVSGTGTFWFPVAPGITTLPTEPAIVDGEMDATNVVLPYNETAIYDGRLRLGAVVSKFTYALELLTEVDPIELRLGAVVRKVTLVTAPAADIALAAAAPIVSTGAAVNSPASSISIAGAPPAVFSGASVLVGSASIAVAPAPGPIVPRLATVTSVPAASIAIAADAPSIVSGVSVEIPVANVAVAGAAPVQVGYVDPNFNSVSLLLHMDGSNNSTTFTDSSPNTFTVSAFGDAKISTAQSKFGGSSGFFDGAGDYLNVGANSAFSYGTGDFTVEFWYWSSSIPSSTTFRRILAHPSSSSATNSFQIWHAGGTASGATVDAVELATPTSNGVTVSVLTAVSDSSWHHIAFTRQSGTSRAFLDGVLKQSAADTNNYTRGGTEGIRISSRGDLAANTFINGYVDDLRITKGVARYTANFTVPPQAFPDK